MLLHEHIRSLISTLESKNSVLTEAKGHIDHPEDMIFLGGSQGANSALKAIVDTVAKPEVATIKWDGYPALIFGRGTNNKFILVDKHMFNRADGTGRAIYSPQQFVQYDADRGVNRSNLHQVIATLWPELERSSRGLEGFFWSDLIFAQPLQDDGGLYKFRANPNGIAYTVEVNSEIGKLMAGKQCGIAVHQSIPRNAPEEAAELTAAGDPTAPTDLSVSLNGSLGGLKPATTVAIIPAKMPNTPQLRISAPDVAKVKQLITQWSQPVDAMFAQPPMSRKTFTELFTKYINARVRAGNFNGLLSGFYRWLSTQNMTDRMRSRLMPYLEEHGRGVRGAFTIWTALYRLKMPVVKQLDRAAANSPVKGYLQSGVQSQEGYVSHGVKFIDRLGFSAQNLQGR